MKNLTSINKLKVDEIMELFRISSELKLNSITEELKDKKVLLAFFEASTRTKLSFEIAAKNLGAKVIDFLPEFSSILKGESLIETLRTIETMGVDCLIIRHKEEGTSEILAEALKIPVINAGDGSNEHPTQALLDAFTIYEIFHDLIGLRLTICGDIEHSRVARSNFHLLQQLGVDVSICAPESLVEDIFISDIIYTNNFENIDDAVENSDVIMSLRIQKERIKDKDENIPDSEEYFKKYGFKKKHFEDNRSIYLMHPGPVNYGVEAEEGVQFHDRSLIDKQVSNGVLIRMAMLKKLLG